VCAHPRTDKESDTARPPRLVHPSATGPVDQPSPSSGVTVTLRASWCGD
jgi:hypothetical protein